MSIYSSIINSTIDFIEVNIREPLTLQSLSEQASVSRFHYNRMFKAVTGVSLNQYVLGRKLTQALDVLNQGEKSVLEVALDYGFEYPEVFSRAFKRYFGVSPSNAAESDLSDRRLMPLEPIDREFVNFEGQLIVKGTPCSIMPKSLRGMGISVDTLSPTYAEDTRKIGDLFAAHILPDQLWTVVKCQGRSDGWYDFFYGIDENLELTSSQRDGLSLENSFRPEGCKYMCFEYIGDIYHIQETFLLDLYRWLMVKNMKPKECNVGMIARLASGFPKDKTVFLMIPIEERQQ